MVLVESVTKAFNISRGNIRIGLDGDSVIKVVNQGNPTMMRDSFDILQGIVYKRQRLKIGCGIFWIRGH